MLMTILLFISGFCLSSISTVYAVVGLMSIFPAAPLSIMLMGTALEVSKLVIASWLYRNWGEIPKFLRTYFCIAMVVLMFLTSMSIFGYLSKAHMDASLTSGESIAALQLIDDKIATQRGNVDQDKKALAQMDASVNEMMSRTTDATGITKAMHFRKSQAQERLNIDKDINEVQATIAKLQIDRVPLATAVRKVDAEVGPIKYIANLLYGDKIDDTLLEKAVRIVILMIVFVFDPLAVLLLIAANWNLKYQASLKKIVVIQDEPDKSPKETITNDFIKQVEICAPDLVEPVIKTNPVSVSNPDDICARTEVNDDLSWSWIEPKLVPTEVICYPSEPKLTPTEIVCYPTEQRLMPIELQDESTEIERLIYANTAAEIEKFYRVYPIKLASYVIVTDKIDIAVS